MSSDKFKNAPIHDKQAIISMMDELEPKDMIEVVELLKSKQQKAYKQQTAVEQLISKIPLGIRMQLAELGVDFEQAKERDKEQKLNMFNCGRQYQVTGEGTFKQVYQEIYGGDNK